MDAFDRGEEKHQQQFKKVEDLAAFKYGLDQALLRALHGAGVPLLLATDCGTGGMGIVPGFSIHDELRILTENGVTPYQALAAGTVEASKVVAAMGGVDDFGTVEVGKRADLLLLRENPLEDVAHVRAPLGVMAAGRWYPAETLAAMIALDEKSVNPGDPVLPSGVPQQVDQGLAIRERPVKGAPQIVDDPLIVVQHCGQDDDQKDDVHRDRNEQGENRTAVSDVWLFALEFLHEPDIVEGQRDPD